VPDVEHFNLLRILQDSIYYVIGMRIMTVEQVPQLVTTAGHRTSARLHFQTKNGLFEPKIPFQGRFGMICVDFSVQLSEITLSAGSDANEVCHA